MSLKRSFSQLTDFESQSQSQSMPYVARSSKRPRRVRTSYSRRIPRKLSPGAGGNRAIIPLTYNYDFDLSTDRRLAFSFDTVNAYINGTASTITGSAEVNAVYGLMRVMKVEVSLMPAATDLAYNDQSLSSGSTNIPYVIEAVDYEDGAQPDLIELRQNATARTHLFNKVIKRTFYPRIDGNNGVIDVGANQKNIFQRSGTIGSSQRWNAWKFVTDNVAVNWTYGTGRAYFKIYYECMQSK